MHCGNDDGDGDGDGDQRRWRWRNKETDSTKNPVTTRMRVNHMTAACGVEMSTDADADDE